jgi:hypothetical protein
LEHVDRLRLNVLEHTMKLEYLARGSADCPLIRLYDFTPVEAGKLHAAIADLTRGSCEEVEIHRQPWIEPLRSCSLSFGVCARDQGLLLKSPPANFECRFTAGTWDNVAGLVEPFTEGAIGFQWLAGILGAGRLLLSVDGFW